jgi:hypothetical protein
MRRLSMNKAEIVKGFAYISVAYKNFLEEGKEEVAVELWHDLLKNYSYESFEIAVKKHILNSRFYPTIYDIISNIKEQNNIDGHEAWRVLLDNINKYGSYRETEALAALPEPIMKAVKMIGYKKLCMSDGNDFERNNFIAVLEKVYDTKEEQNILQQLRVEDDDKRKRLL